MRFLITIFFIISFLNIHAQRVDISGIVSFGKQPVAGVSVSLQKSTHGTITDEYGKFRLQNISPGEYVLEISSVGYLTVLKTIRVENSSLFVQVPLSTHIKSLDSVTVQSAEKMNSGFTRLRDVEGTATSISRITCRCHNCKKSVSTNSQIKIIASFKQRSLCIL